MSKKGRQNVLNKQLEKEFVVYDASAVILRTYLCLLFFWSLFVL